MYEMLQGKTILYARGEVDLNSTLTNLYILFALGKKSSLSRDGQIFSSHFRSVWNL